ncbi:hypothetical protein ALC60_10781 [Trachymyrmex zeteki]|uniref:Uncharacterized protein n=1 Tax=Mycetomoellerius zeteki TaxID=64791 RepID=A0A151WQQ8_9HYME|nr:hypothetical protein ALC60_10781 [Trachymyrmex zeteki]
MLFTTTYGLNNSHTKTIHVGLQRTSEGIFKSLVKLSGNNADGIYFDADSWKQFQDNMGLMNEYLTSDNTAKTNSVVIKNISISFTTSYGAKSILAYKEEEEEFRSMENISGNLRKEEITSDSTPRRRKEVLAMSENVIRGSGIFNTHQLVDCELSALVFNTYEGNDVKKIRIKYFSFASQEEEEEGGWGRGRERRGEEEEEEGASVNNHEEGASADNHEEGAFADKHEEILQFLLDFFYHLIEIADKVAEVMKEEEEEK